MKRWGSLRIVMLLCVIALSLQGCGGGSGGVGVDGESESVTLASIVITSNSQSIPVGAVQRYKATGIYSDNTTADLTGSVHWKSSNTSVANFNYVHNQIETIGFGVTTITAYFPNQVSIFGSQNLTVRAQPAFISVTPNTHTMTVNSTQQFKAIGTYSDNTTEDLTELVTWGADYVYSLNSYTVTISNAEGSKGSVVSVGIGLTKITAKLGSIISGSTPLLVGISNVAGSLDFTVGGTADGFGRLAEFNNPQGITTDGINLYVTDANNNAIRKIVIATGMVTTFAGSGTPGYFDGVGTSARFRNPHGITTDGINLYVTDTENSAIRKIVIASGTVTTLADGGTSDEFGQLKGITTDGKNLYVADGSRYCIRKIVIATGMVTTLAGSGTKGYLDGVGTSARFDYPYGITTDGINLYVSDNNAIRKIVIATGMVTTLAGSGTKGYLDGVGTSAQFELNYGITTDGTNLYVSDFNNHALRKIDISTGTVTTVSRFISVSDIIIYGSNLYMTIWQNSILKL